MKNIRTLKTLVAFFFFVFALLIISCKKESSTELSSTGKNKLYVYITDNPVAFQNVFIDIQAVEVKTDTCTSSTSGDDDDDSEDDHGDGSDDSCEVWQSLQINPGIYDLLRFRNGTDTLLANGTIPEGKIKAIRLTLGSRNSVVIDSVTYPLTLKKNKVVIKIEHVQQLSRDNFKINLDFDLCGSIIRIRDNEFELNPHIKSFDEKESGEIEGRVLPVDAKAVISAIGDKDTLFAIPDEDGEFKIRGINSNSVDLMINATANNYRDTLIRNIIISPDREIKLATITLHK
ncbi:MAG TPA: DUF4382 domain-containing protein [Chitinophagaceae bacterium]|nr:DUF4382 domain-containing protein [Chitinophagaceae bacterium]